jgi:dUTP pyrophosphatase
MEAMRFKFKKLDPAAIPPAYAHPGDAGMDFFALERTVLNQGERKGIRTGVSIEIPKGCVGLFWDKSGIGIREGLKTLGGVIDAGYRGEVMIGMINLSDKEYVFEAGHKVAQLLIQKVEHCDIEETKDLSQTKRGKGGFGSTGK